MLIFFRFSSIILVLASFGFSNCKKTSVLKFEKLKIGSGTESLDKIYINKQSTRDIMLFGGNKNYSVAVEKSDLVSMKIYDDTLRVKGLFEGVTFATVASADEQKRIEIHVIPQSIFFSQDTVYIYPGYGVDDQNTQIKLTGGGEAPILKIHDTDNIISVKWDAKSNYLKIISYKEGVAYITALSQDGTQSQKLVVIVRAEDADSVYTKRGIYKTTNRTTLNNLVMRISCLKVINEISSQTTVNNCNCENSTEITSANNNNLCWLIQSPIFYNLYENLNPTEKKYRCMRICVKNSNNNFPFKQGDYVEVEVKNDNNSNPPITDKTYRLFVENISGDTLVTLRGSGIKYVLPCPNKYKSK